MEELADFAKASPFIGLASASGMVFRTINCFDFINDRFNLRDGAA
ncbi:hypothetical protein [Burkholderia stagnalis]|nr:hypothetical protein [Burkholderia stagnalis]